MSLFIPENAEGIITETYDKSSTFYHEIIL